GQVGVGAGGQQDVAGLGDAGGAGGAGGTGDALGVEEQQQRVALAAGEGEVGVGREPPPGRGVAAEDGVRDGLADRGDQVVAQRADLAGEPLPLLGGQPSGDREGGDG